MGYALAPSPLFSNTIAGLALTLCGSDDQRERYLRPLAARREARHAGALGRGLPGDARRLHDGGQAGRRRRRPRRREGPRPRCGQRRLLPRRHLRWQAAPGRARRRRASPSRAEPSIDPTRRLSSVRLDGVRVAAADTLPGAGGRLPPGLLPPLRRPCRGVDRDRPADDGDGGRVRQRPQAVRPPDRLLPGRLPPLCADAAGDRERALGRLRRRLGRRRASPSRCRWRPRSPRPTPPTPAGGSPTPRSRSTAGSASPGSTTSTSSSSAARSNAAMFGDAKWHRERVADAVLARPRRRVAA